MKKTALLAAAVLLFAFYNYGLYQWFRSAHSFADVFKAVRSDWLLTITVVDMGVLSLCCVVWLWADMRGRRWPVGKRAGVMVATLIVGAVALFLYLAFRRSGRAEEPSFASNP